MARSSIDRAYRDFSIRREQSLKEIKASEKTEINSIRQRGLKLTVEGEECLIQIPLGIKKDLDGDTSKSVLQSTLISNRAYQGPAPSKVFQADLSAISSEPSLVDELQKKRRQSLEKLAQERDETINTLKNFFTELRNSLPQEVLNCNLSDLPKLNIDFEF